MGLETLVEGTTVAAIAERSGSATWTASVCSEGGYSYSNSLALPLAHFTQQLEARGSSATLTLSVELYDTNSMTQDVYLVAVGCADATPLVSVPPVGATCHCTVCCIRAWVQRLCLLAWYTQ